MDFLVHFTHKADVNTPDTIDTWDAVNYHNSYSFLLTKITFMSLMTMAEKPTFLNSFD